MGYRVAIVGATGNVGREMLTILEELKFPADEVHAFRAWWLDADAGRQCTESKYPNATTITLPGK